MSSVPPGASMDINSPGSSYVKTDLINYKRLHRWHIKINLGGFLLSVTNDIHCA